MVYRGSAYALLAAGYALTYRAAGGFNLAFTIIAAFGAISATWLFATAHPLWQCIAGGIIAGGLLGIATDKVALLPARLRPRGPLGQNQALIATAAAGSSFYAVVQRGGALSYWGRALFAASHPAAATLERLQILAAFGSALALAGVWLFFRFTRYGVVERALAANPASARASGVGREWVIAQAVFIASSLGACAGIALSVGLTIDSAGTGMSGFIPGALCAAVLGGLAAPQGGVLSGFLVAAAQGVAGLWGVEESVTAFVLMLAGLTFVPQGLLRRASPQQPESMA